MPKDPLLSLYLTQILNSSWFFALDLCGTVAFAVSGLIIAYNQNKSWFGALFMATLPAIGGGVIRDLLVNRHPIAILQTPAYLIAVLLTVSIGIAVVRILNNRTFPRPLNYIFHVSDAIGLAAFTIIGGVVAVITHAEPLWLWMPFLAVITGAGGGILRDLFRYDRYITALMGEIYAEVAAIWGLIFAMFIYWQRSRSNFDEILIGIVVIFLATLVTRLVVYAKDIHSPLFKQTDADVA